MKERKRYTLEDIFTVTEIPSDDSCRDLGAYIQGVSTEIMASIEIALQEKKYIKYFLTLDLELYRPTELELQFNNVTFRSNIYQAGSLTEVNLDEIIQHLIIQLEVYNQRGSGWVFGCVKKCTLTTALFRPLTGSSFLRTPPDILNKNAVVNIENDDNKCFLWSVLAHLHPAKKNPNRLYHYKKFANELNVEGLTFPLNVSDVPKFEKLNTSLKINVLMYEEKDCIPLYVSKFHDRPTHINLLLLSDDSKHHYVLIRNMSRLVASRSAYNGKHYVCDHCLHPFTVKDAFDRHVPHCCMHAPQRVVYPEPGTILKWDSPMKTQRLTHIIYCDFESFIVKGVKKDMHVPSGYCCHTVSAFEEYQTEPTLYSGENVMDHFFNHIMEEHERISRILNKNVPMRDLTPDQLREHIEATVCNVCEQEFDDKNCKVHDHCHVTGSYRQAACASCNLQLKHPYTHVDKCRRFLINVVIHNLKGYDSHLILKHFNRRVVDGEITVIASNSERYISFEFAGIRFLDSFQFMASSLNELVSNLNSNMFMQTNRWLKHPELMKSKGVYPYEYMDGRDRFTETQLPPKECFYSKLTEEEITDEEYDRAQLVWKTYGCKTMQDYHDIYLKSDVLLLADVFEAFRTMSLETYKLDPCHYYTAPGLAWDAMLKHTKVNLELISDPEIFLLLENSIRGGVAMISKRYAKANNPLVDGYDDTKPTTWLLYLDANNLYGWGQSQMLPISDFRMLKDKEIAQLDYMNLSQDSKTGYILEVDLLYPEHLHDSHNDYPLAPEKLRISRGMLSEYSKELSTGQVMTEKLIPNLNDKQNYVLHYRNLQFYVKLGMVVTKVHRVLSFTQSAWLKPYIELNTTMRQKATNEFEKNFFKLMNNACFGKTLQNDRSHLQLRLITSADRARKLVAKPNFKYSRWINDDLVAIEMGKPKIKLIRPIYAGHTVLELSKLLMYDYYYNVMKQRYGNLVELCMTDTDSILCLVQTENVYDDMYEDKAKYDTSNYKKDNRLYSNVNAKVVGLMKDETAGEAVTEFVGLKAKMYSLLVKKNDSKMTAKGIKRSYLKHHLTHDLYLHTLNTRKCTRANFLRIASQNHQLYTTEVDKVCLSAFDDKRYILEDGLTTLAHGHYSIKLSCHDNV